LPGSKRQNASSGFRTQPVGGVQDPGDILEGPAHWPREEILRNMFKTLTEVTQEDDEMEEGDAQDELPEDWKDRCLAMLLSLYSQSTATKLEKSLSHWRESLRENLGLGPALQGLIDGDGSIMLMDTLNSHESCWQKLCLVIGLYSNTKQKESLEKLGFVSDIGKWTINHTLKAKERPNTDDDESTHDPKGRNFHMFDFNSVAFLVALAFESPIVACRKLPQIALALQAISMGLFGDAVQSEDPSGERKVALGGIRKALRRADGGYNSLGWTFELYYEHYKEFLARLDDTTFW